MPSPVSGFKYGHWAGAALLSVSCRSLRVMLSFSCCSKVSCITIRLTQRPRLLHPMWLPLLNIPPVALQPHLADRNQCRLTWFSCHHHSQADAQGRAHHRSPPPPRTLSGCPTVPRAPTWYLDKLLGLVFPQSCFCLGLKARTQAWFQTGPVRHWSAPHCPLQGPQIYHRLYLLLHEN